MFLPAQEVSWLLFTLLKNFHQFVTYYYVIIGPHPTRTLPNKSIAAFWFQCSHLDQGQLSLSRCSAQKEKRSQHFPIYYEDTLRAVMDVKYQEKHQRIGHYYQNLRPCNHFLKMTISLYYYCVLEWQNDRSIN